MKLRDFGSRMAHVDLTSGSVEIKSAPAQARQHLERVLAHPDSVAAPNAAAELAELLLESGDSEALLSGDTVSYALARPKSRTLIFPSGVS